MAQHSHDSGAAVTSHGGRGSLSAQRARHQKIAEAVIKRGSMSVEALATAAGDG